MSDLTPVQALAAGNRINFRDGSSAEVRYTFRSLALLETRFGSVQGIQTAIDQTGNGAAFGPVIDLIGAALTGADGGFTPHLRHRQDAAGNRTLEEIIYRRSSDGRELGDLMDPAQIQPYIDAMQQAFVTCFGTAGGQGNDHGPTELSPGPISSTSEPSS